MLHFLRAGESITEFPQTADGWCSITIRLSQAAPDRVYVVWDKQFYVFYHDEDAPLHRSPRASPMEPIGTPSYPRSYTFQVLHGMPESRASPSPG